MPRDTERRFRRELAKLQPGLRRSFLQAVSDIKRTADVNRLQAALSAGDVDAALDVLRLGPELLAPLEDSLRTVFAAGGQYQISSLPRKNPDTGTELVVRFQGQNPRAQEWLTRSAGNLIVEMTSDQRNVVREVMTAGVQAGRNPRSIALDIVGRVKNGRRQGGVVGLTSREAQTLERFRQGLLDEGRSPTQVARMTARRSNVMLRRRGERIARTEATRAMNAGRLEGARQIVEQTDVTEDQVFKRWDDAGDGRVRSTHADMDGQVRGMEEPFSSPSGALLMMPGDTSLGAGGEEVIHCRCYAAIIIDFLRRGRRR